MSPKQPDTVWRTGRTGARTDGHKVDPKVVCFLEFAAPPWRPFVLPQYLPFPEVRDGLEGFSCDFLSLRSFKAVSNWWIASLLSWGSDVGKVTFWVVVVGRVVVWGRPLKHRTSTGLAAGKRKMEYWSIVLLHAYFKWIRGSKKYRNGQVGQLKLFWWSGLQS